ncbi:MAG: TolC family protein [Candidatus Binatia bacterium]
MCSLTMFTTLCRTRIGDAWLPGLLVLLSSFALVSSGAAEPLTIERAVALARQHNPDILATRQQIGVARGRLQKARYWNPFNPEIGGGAVQRRFDGGGSDVQRSASVSLEVEVAGQRGQRIDEARQNLTGTTAQVADVERLVVAQVKEAFYRVLYLRRRLQLFRKVERLNQRLRHASAERFKSGEVPKLEANLAVVRHSQSRKDTLAAARDYRNGVRGLERLLGAEPTGTTVLSGDLAVRPVKVDADALVETALRIRPDLRARDAEIGRVQAETALTKRLIVPNPVLRGTYDEETESAGSRDRIIGGAVSIPLPIFDRKQAELTALAAERARANYQRDATALTVKTEVRDAYRSYEAAREGVQVFEAEAVQRIAENFRFIETAYREGKIDLLQLVVVQNDLVTAQFSYLDSLWDYWLARTALERAVGRPLKEGPS